MGSSSLAEIAAPVVCALEALPGVCGILCFGSHAAGTADVLSDIDLYVICQPDLPSAADRRAAFSSLRQITALEIGHVEAGWDTSWCPQTDRLQSGPQFFDISYNTLSFVETVVQGVRRGEVSVPEMPFRPYTLLGMLAEAVPLYDRDRRLHKMRDSLYPYPGRLKERLLADNRAAARDSIAELADYTARGVGRRAFHFHQGRVFDALEGLLFAINERYEPASKRIELALEGLPLLPENFSNRYTNLLETPLTPRGMEKIANDLQLLLDEIEALIPAGEVVKSEFHRSGCAP